jgi:hypothetical protein
MGTLTVKSTPSGADVRVDGNRMGQTPAGMFLPPGQHTVVLEKDGFARAEKAVRLEAAKQESLQVRLEPEVGNRREGKVAEARPGSSAPTGEGPAAPGLPRTADTANLDFSGMDAYGRLIGWKEVGSAISYKGYSVVSAERARALLFDGEAPQGAFRYVTSLRKGSDARGELLSGMFRITGGRLVFWMCGPLQPLSNDGETGVGVMMEVFDPDGRVKDRFVATGRDDRKLRKVEWDVAAHKGAIARLRIIEKPQTRTVYHHIVCTGFRME